MIATYHLKELDERGEQSPFSFGIIVCNRTLLPIIKNKKIEHRQNLKVIICRHRQSRKRITEKILENVLTHIDMC